MKNNKTNVKPANAGQAKTVAPSPKAAPKAWLKWTVEILPYLLCCITLVVLGNMLCSQEWEMLYRSQELSLFLPTRQFYDTLTIYPGGTLQWLACWATQYFYEPSTGVALLAAFWAVIVLLLAGVYRLRRWAVLLGLLPVLMLMACIVQTGYWVYYTKLQGYFFVPTLGIIASLVAVGIYRLIRGSEDSRTKVALSRKLTSQAWIVLFAWFGYIHLGAWSFLGVALMAIPSEWSFVKGVREGKNGMLHCALAVLPLLISGVCLLQVPRIIYYNGIFNQTQIDTLNYACMPSFQYSAVDMPVMHTAYHLLALSFVPIVLVSLLQFVCQRLPLQKLWSVLGPVVVVGLLVCGYNFMNERWYHNQIFQNELKMTRLVNEENWEGVLEVAPVYYETDENVVPSRVMVMMKNLALFRLGREGDDMFNYLEGAKEQSMDSLTIRMTQVGGKHLYYNYGKLNFCYRWCMEDGVEFGWKVEHLKLMAKCALLKSEWKVAEKYLNLLKKTRNHREWAERYEVFLYHPELMEADPGMAPICKLKEFGNRLDGDNTLVELYLLRTFSNGHGVDPIYQRATLMSALIMKDIDLFWPRLHEYIVMHKDEPDFRIPRHYQEAAYLYSMLEPDRPSELWPGYTNAQAMQGIPFDPSVKKSYDDFMAFNSQPRIAPLSDEAKEKEFQPQFGNTFYYFYFLKRNQKTN